ncbi:hypothetical protein OEZ86_002933 [Tetradesmus obliquus]|nr:hypothetical protein OEZ86_002933 [Tetradesmus obliquus]
MQPPPQPVSVPPLLAWLPPSLLLHLRSLAHFLAACWGLLREFHAPTLGEALRRLALVLGASLALIVVVSTIDSGWLYCYLLNARRVPVAA